MVELGNLDGSGPVKRERVEIAEVNNQVRAQSSQARVFVNPRTFRRGERMVVFSLARLVARAPSAARRLG